MTFTNAGRVVVRASQRGDGFFAPAANVDQSFLVAAGNNVFVEASRLSDGSFKLVFAGELGRSYILESSADLIQWSPVITNLVNSLGNLEFTDRSALARQHIFYRVRAQ